VSALGWRDYRWTWLWLAVRWSLTPLLLLLAIILYYPACVITATFDGIADRLAAVQVRCYNRDLARKHGYARCPGEARPDGWLP
jgi:hypothetical protein